MWVPQQHARWVPAGREYAISDVYSFESWYEGCVLVHAGYAFCLHEFRCGFMFMFVRVCGCGYGYGCEYSQAR